MYKILFCLVVTAELFTQLKSHNAKVQIRTSDANANEDENIDLKSNLKALASREEKLLNKKRRSKRMQNEIQNALNNIAKIDKYFLDNTHNFEMITDCNKKLTQLRSDFEQMSLKEIEAMPSLDDLAAKEWDKSGSGNYLHFYTSENTIMSDKDDTFFYSVNNSNTSSHILDNIKKQLIDYLK